MAKLNVGKWQAARRGPSYTPVMQFFLRQIRMAMFEALRVKDVPCMYGMLELAASDNEFAQAHALAFTREKRLWDEAIMARHWIASEAPLQRHDPIGYLLSFDAACAALGLDADHERVWMLAKIDEAADFDTEEVWQRIQYLTENPPDEQEEELFDAPRCVPELDQGTMWTMFGEAA